MGSAKYLLLVGSGATFSSTGCGWLMNWKIGQGSSAKTINRSEMEKALEKKTLVITLINIRKMMTPNLSMTSIQKPTVTSNGLTGKTSDQMNLLSMTSIQMPTMTSNGLTGETSDQMNLSMALILNGKMTFEMLPFNMRIMVK